MAGFLEDYPARLKRNESPGVWAFFVLASRVCFNGIPKKFLKFSAPTVGTQTLALAREQSYNLYMVSGFDVGDRR